MSPLSRRAFLGLAGGAAGAALVGTAAWSRLADDDAAQLTPRSGDRGARRDRILVVVEMEGGNDGLNTVVPADGRYRDARPTLAIPENDLVRLTGTDEFALHPGLAALAPLWEARQLAAINAVGLEGQTRSHFAATDRWRAGRADATPGATSWLGRWLDATAAEEASPLRAIALGADTRVLATERSETTVILSPDSFDLQAPSVPGVDATRVVAAFDALARPAGANPLFADVQRAIPSTIRAVEVLDQASPDTGATGSVTEAARPDRATALLGTVARIIELDVGTQVFVVGVQGYDTHGRQADHHARLLTDLGNGIAEFLAAMEVQGRADDVLVMTTSEFGRRVAENGSAGTDHGNAGVQFFAGRPIQGGIIGEPGIDRQIDGDLPIDVDTRSLYAIGLDWLGGPTDEILGGTYDRLDLLAPTEPATNTSVVSSPDDP